MKKIIPGILFSTLIFLGNISVQAQKSPPTERGCQPSIEEILFVVKSAYGFSPSPREFWVAGEIQGGWGELHIPQELLTLTKVLAMLGGVLKSASGSIYLIRQTAEDQPKTKMQININDIKKGLVEDIKLEKGDLIFVPRGCIDNKLLMPAKTDFLRIQPRPNINLTDSPIHSNKYVIS